MARQRRRAMVTARRRKIWATTGAELEVVAPGVPQQIDLLFELQQAMQGMPVGITVGPIYLWIHGWTLAAIPQGNIGAIIAGVRRGGNVTDPDDMDPHLFRHQDWMSWLPVAFRGATGETAGFGLQDDATIKIGTKRRIDEAEETLWYTHRVDAIDNGTFPTSNIRVWSRTMVTLP